jgi:long-chain acyl-CoA synthetase
MVKLLIDHPSVAKYDLRSLKTLIYGGGPMHVEDLRTAITKLGPCLTQLYGMGETPMTITYLPHKDHVVEGTPDQLKRLASAGIHRTGVDVQVVNPQDTEAPYGQMGEVVVRSDVVMRVLAPSHSRGHCAWLASSGDLIYMDGTVILSHGPLEGHDHQWW